VYKCVGKDSKMRDNKIMEQQFKQVAVLLGIAAITAGLALTTQTEFYDVSVAFRAEPFGARGQVGRLAPRAFTVLGLDDAAARYQLRVIDQVTQQVVSTIALNKEVKDLATSPSRAYSVDRDGGVHVVDLNTQSVSTFPLNSIKVATTPNGQRLAVLNDNPTDGLRVSTYQQSDMSLIGHINLGETDPENDYVFAVSPNGVLAVAVEALRDNNPFRHTRAYVVNLATQQFVGSIDIPLILPPSLKRAITNPIGFVPHAVDLVFDSNSHAWVSVRNAPHTTAAHAVVKLDTSALRVARTYSFSTTGLARDIDILTDPVTNQEFIYAIEDVDPLTMIRIDTNNGTMIQNSFSGTTRGKELAIAWRPNVSQPSVYVMNSSNSTVELYEITPDLTSLNTIFNVPNPTGTIFTQWMDVSFDRQHLMIYVDNASPDLSNDDKLVFLKLANYNPSSILTIGNARLNYAQHTYVRPMYFYEPEYATPFR
jgi:hypothetical protein